MNERTEANAGLAGSMHTNAYTVRSHHWTNYLNPVRIKRDY
jgi:hypothetical protein